MAVYENLGIDFGTCSIKISDYNAKRDEMKAVRIDKKDTNDDRKVPNVIRYDARDKFILGDVALRSKVNRNLSNNIVELIKIKLEAEKWTKKFEDLGFSLTAEDIAADIFSCINNAIKNNGQDIQSAVVTVPVCFTEVQRNRIVKAATKAGLPVLNSISEPVAALFAFKEEFFEDECDENVVVFDFGGATLDLCLAHVENYGDIDIDIIATKGWLFGGTDVTRMIYDEIIYPAYKDVIEEEKSLSTTGIVESDFMEIAESLKTKAFDEYEVDEEEEITEYFVNGQKHRNISVVLTKKEIINCLNKNKFFDKLRLILDDLFFDCDLEKNDVTKVKIIGGTSRMSIIREFLNDYFGEDICDMDCDYEITYRSVANGASYYAYLLNNETNINITNSIPYSINMLIEGQFKRVLSRNQKYNTFTPRKKLVLDELEQNNWKIPLYQAFSMQDDVSFSEKDSAIYMGSFKLDSEAYDKNLVTMYRIGIDNNGQAVLETYVLDEESELSKVESVIVTIGE